MPPARAPRAPGHVSRSAEPTIRRWRSRRGQRASSRRDVAAHAKRLELLARFFRLLTRSARPGTPARHVALRRSDHLGIGLDTGRRDLTLHLLGAVGIG